MHSDAAQYQMFCAQLVRVYNFHHTLGRTNGVYKKHTLTHSVTHTAHHTHKSSVNDVVVSGRPGDRRADSRTWLLLTVLKAREPIYVCIL